ncbi:MAG: cold-shock protein [Planctomycetaceae bacterium]
MPEGTIATLVPTRGFGFVRTERGNLFFHRTAVKDAEFEQLHEGQAVKYEIGNGAQGRTCATSIAPCVGRASE